MGEERRVTLDTRQWLCGQKRMGALTSATTFNTHWFFLTPWKKAKGEVQDQGSHVGGILQRTRGRCKARCLKFVLCGSNLNLNRRLSRWTIESTAQHRCQAPHYGKAASRGPPTDTQKYLSRHEPHMEQMGSAKQGVPLIQSTTQTDQKKKYHPNWQSLSYHPRSG